MSAKAEIEFFVTVNEDGDFDLCTDGDEAQSDASSNIGGYRLRTFRVKMILPLPRDHETVNIEVPDTGLPETTVTATVDDAA